MQINIKTILLLFIGQFYFYQVFADENRVVIDWHTHVAGLGYGDSGNFVNETMRKNFRFKFFMKWMNVNEPELEEYGDQIVVKRLNDQLEASSKVHKAVVLAIDGRVDKKTGELDRENTLYYVDNDFVATETGKYPKLLYGASINPNRQDSINRLKNAYDNGAVLIKWIPSIMNIDPADERFIPFYKKMVELDLPLLSHTGNENSFPGAINALADPVRLKLPLQLGVTVIAAHVATTGKIEGERNFDRLLLMFNEYDNLYADISSLTQINKLGYLAELLEKPGLTSRLIYGTDWPLQYFPVVSTWYHLRYIGFQNAWRTGRIENLWDRDIALKMAFGVPEDVYSRQLGRIISLQGNRGN